MHGKIWTLGLLVFLLAALAGCDQSDPSYETVSGTISFPSITDFSGTISVSQLGQDGSQKALCQSDVDNGGNFDCDIDLNQLSRISAHYNYLLLTWTRNQTLGQTLLTSDRAIRKTVTINSATSIETARALQLLKTGVLLKVSSETARTQVQTFFGVGSFSTSKSQGVLDATLTTVASNHSISTQTLVSLIASDAADGKLDGLDPSGNPLSSGNLNLATLWSGGEFSTALNTAWTAVATPADPSTVSLTLIPTPPTCLDFDFVSPISVAFQRAVQVQWTNPLTPADISLGLNSNCSGGSDAQAFNAIAGQSLTTKPLQPGITYNLCIQTQCGRHQIDFRVAEDAS